MFPGRKNLPNSPRKKSEVIGNLAKKYNLKVKLIEPQGRKSKILSPEQDQWLTDFLERPEMSYTNPGRKDNVYIGKTDGIRQYVQKKYILWTLRDALGIINNEDDGFNVNFDEYLSFAVIFTALERLKNNSFSSVIFLKLLAFVKFVKMQK